MRSINLGRKSGSSGPEMSKPSKGPSVYYTSFDISGIDLPFTSKDVGKTITVPMTLKINKAGHEIDTYGDRKKSYRASFSVIAMSVPGKSKTKVDSSTPKDVLDGLEKQEFLSMSRRK